MPVPASRATYEGVLAQALANTLLVLDLALGAAGQGTELAAHEPGVIRF
jgi:hypothetical protein